MGNILKNVRNFVLLVVMLGWVGEAAAATALSTSPNPSLQGQTVVLTATITSDYPTPGTITFKDGATVLGTVAVGSCVQPIPSGAGTASLSYTFSVAGAHSLTASYSGGKCQYYAYSITSPASTSPIVTQTVNLATSSTVLSSSPNPSTAGQTVTLSATVTGATPTGTVTFKDGSTVLGTSSLIAGRATLGTTFATSGSHTLTATYSGDSRNTLSTSPPISQTVNGATSATVLGVSPNPSVVGQVVNLTASISGYPAPGTITFRDGTTVLGTVPIGTSVSPPPAGAGTATFSYTFNTAGAHNLTASYSGGTYQNYGYSISVPPSVSPAVTQTVNQGSCTAVLASSLNPSVAGQGVTLTTTVTGITPTGTVTFNDGTTVLGTASLANGQASIGTTFAAAGTHSLTAVYGGDANNLACGSSAVSQTVTAATTGTVLGVDSNPSVVGQAVNLTAVLSGYPAPGTITFRDGTTVLGTVPIGSSISPPPAGANTAVLSYTFNTAGPHSLTASYSGGTFQSYGYSITNQPSTSSTVSQTVGQSPTIATLRSNANPSILGQSTELTATVTGFMPNGEVTFLDGTTVLGTATISGGQATFNATFNTVGLHSLSASYIGDTNNLASTSAGIAQQIQSLTTTVLTTSSNPSLNGQTVTLTAVISGVSPSGTVSFQDGTISLGSATIAAGRATLTTTFGTVGAHSLTATYIGDSNNLGSISSAVSQIVQTSTTTTLGSSANPSVAGQAVTLTAAVTGVSPSGTVNFMDGATSLGASTIAAGQATLPYTFINVGIHNLTAVYSGDTYNLTSTSAVVAETITIATSTTSLSVTPSLVATDQGATLTAIVTGALPNGTVTFTDGGGKTLTANVGAGKATVPITYNTVGAYNLTAAYSGDANNTASTSAPATLTVKLPSATALTATPTSLLAGQLVTFTATVTGTTTPTGTVTFNEGATILGTANVVAGTSTLNYAFSTAGVHNPTATYVGDADFVPSTSASVSINVAADSITYFHNDVAGTPMAATDAAGNLLWKESYRPYGDPMQPPATDNNIWFTGKPYDKDSGLTYMGARYYDPLIGRFTGIDPVGFDENNLHSFNRYAYANNNPNKFVDPDGRSPIDVKDDGFESDLGLMITIVRAWRALAVSSEAKAAAETGAVARASAGAETVAAESTAVKAANAAGKEIGQSESQIIHTDPRNLIPTQTRSEMSGSQVKRLAKDMKENGYDQSKPISAQRNERGRLEITDGHHRREAAIKAGVEKVPVEVSGQ